MFNVMATRAMHFLSIYLCFSALFMTISLSYSDLERDDTAFYRKMSIDNYNLCSVITNRKIVFNETQNALWVTHSSVKRTNDFICNFKVDAYEKDGLFAVIRRINFRYDTVTGECIDYVQFHASDNTKRKFCGNRALNTDRIALFNSSPLDVMNLAFIDRSGKLRVTIFIAKEPLPAGMKVLDLDIVFTGYNSCDRQYSAHCIPDNLNYCINKAYVSDGHVNCPFRDCGDEATCDVPEFTVGLLDEPVSSTKVVLSAIGSLAVSFLVFIVVLWFCKKAHLICFNEECMNSGARGSTAARVDTARHNEPSRVIEMENRAEGDLVAPNTRPAVTPDADKDLPPSYESLFANR